MLGRDCISSANHVQESHTLQDTFSDELIIGFKYCYLPEGTQKLPFFSFNSFLNFSDLVKATVLSPGLAVQLHSQRDVRIFIKTNNFFK